ncbi:hypothetical protein ACFWD7_30535 [Streptomyces mirabilis]|uniref:hypothetical protein n=1 Tax=Streptomyces mirabilis TaxID=68239 RepID=UPI0021BE6013|nr:hypothetical protein [Streptomyces mirabilis]MCT9109366.1 hypothetical protein [Streptomyces mirabilis]
MLGGLVSAAPATADEPGDNPANPYERTLRISLGSQARKDRCQGARAVHYGGPELKSVAAAKLTGTDAGLRAFVRPDAIGGEWAQAAQRDDDAGLADLKAFRDRQDKLNTTNKPYASVNSSEGRDYWAPEFGKDIVAFTLGTQQDLYNKAVENPTPAGTRGRPRTRASPGRNCSTRPTWATRRRTTSRRSCGSAVFRPRPPSRTRWSSVPRSRR